MEKLKLFLTDKEYSKKLLTTILLIALYRLLFIIPAPFFKGNEPVTVGSTIIETNNFLNASEGLNLMSVGLGSYISATIFTSIMINFSKRLRIASKEPGGELLIKRRNKILSVLMGFISSFILVSVHWTSGMFKNDNILLLLAVNIPFMLLGTMISLKIAETLDDRGIASGTSLLLGANMILNIKDVFVEVISQYSENIITLGDGFVMLILFFTILLGMVFVSMIEFRIPFTTHKDDEYRDMDRGNYIPFKINTLGAMGMIVSFNIIAAINLVVDLILSNYPNIITYNLFFFYNKYFMSNEIGEFILFSMWLFVVVLAFNRITINTEDISDIMRGSGIIIEGIDPGKDTSSFLRKFINRFVWYDFVYMISFILFMALVLRGVDINLRTSASIIVSISVILDIMKEVILDYKIITVDASL